MKTIKVTLDPDEIRMALTDLIKTVDDMLPQIGGMALQDYEALNMGLVRGRKILKELEQLSIEALRKPDRDNQAGQTTYEMPEEVIKSFKNKR